MDSTVDLPSPINKDFAELAKEMMEFSRIMELGLVELLRAAWFAGVFPLIIASIASSRFSSFHGAILGFAKRGKILQSSSHRFTVPQRLFLHFYVVAVVWTTLLVVMTWFYAYKVVPLDTGTLHFSMVASHLTGGSRIFSMHKTNVTSLEHRHRVWRSVFLLLLMEIQVLRRLYETLYVFNYSPSARMHVFGYLTGLFFYTAAPLSLCSICAPEVFYFAARQAVEFIVRGRDQMRIVEYDLWEYVKPFNQLGWCQWIGAAIFMWGWTHQHCCHSILGSLREHKAHANEYVIPYGDWFEIVSCPHYLAEIVIYAGILFASGGSDLTIWLLFGFVVANLVFAAGETHRWYIQKFDKYPRDRRAIIPFVY